MAPQRYAEAVSYLDAKAPGWRKQTGLDLIQVEEGTATGTEALPPEVTMSVDRAVAKYLEVFADWETLRPSERRQRMLDVANAEVTAAGAPKLHAIDKIVGSSDGVFNSRQWEIAMGSEILFRDGVSVDEFARYAGLVEHEAQHALQWFRMARVDVDQAHKLNLMDEVVDAAREANQGTRDAEDFGPNTIEYAKAKEFYEQIVGDQRAARDWILENLEQKGTELISAREAVEAAPRDSPEYYKAYAEMQARQAAYDETYDHYRRLPEDAASS